MIFDIEERKAVKFNLPDGGWVELKNPDVDDYLKIRNVCIENKPFLVEKKDEKGNDLPPRVFNHPIVDEIKQAVMLNDVSIINWGGIFNKDKKEIPCTLENKTMLMQKSRAFRDFVNEKLEVLRKAEEGEEKEAEKNSLPG